MLVVVSSNPQEGRLEVGTYVKSKLRGDCDLDLDNGDSWWDVLSFTGERTYVPGIVIITLPDNVQASLRHSEIEVTP